jgi:hypothetical protein
MDRRARRRDIDGVANTPTRKHNKRKEQAAYCSASNHCISFPSSFCLCY